MNSLALEHAARAVHAVTSDWPWACAKQEEIDQAYLTARAALIAIREPLGMKPYGSFTAAIDSILKRVGNENA